MLSLASSLLSSGGQCSCLHFRNISPSPYSMVGVFSCSGSLQEMEKAKVRRSLPEFPAIAAAKRVVLVRHGQSTWNEEGRIQGSSDFSILTAKGESQAETSRQMLFGDSFDVCFTSPLIRSKRTAEIIWASREEEMIPESDLREIDLYSFQGLLKHEGKEKFGDAYWQWQRNAANFNIDGHYPVRELWDRAGSCWNKILAHKGKSVLVVAHNAVNQALVATAIGLGTDYFRVLLQSNCGVSVLDFTPKPQGGPPRVCLNRLNQTPSCPIAAGISGGRKTSKRIILVCHEATQSSSEAIFPNMGYEAMNMLGVIQVQEAADCLGADCIPRYVEVKKMLDLEVEPILHQTRTNTMDMLLDTLGVERITNLWNQSNKAWQSMLQELSDESETERNVVVVGHPSIHIALICQCLKLTPEWMESFHLDDGSISVIDFSDGPGGRGIIRCINYTAHLGRWSIPVTRSVAND